MRQELDSALAVQDDTGITLLEDSIASSCDEFDNTRTSAFQPPPPLQAIAQRHGKIDDADDTTPTDVGEGEFEGIDEPPPPAQPLDAALVASFCESLRYDVPRSPMAATRAAVADLACPSATTVRLRFYGTEQAASPRSPVPPVVPGPIPVAAIPEDVDPSAAGGRPPPPPALLLHKLQQLSSPIPNIGCPSPFPSATQMPMDPQLFEYELPEAIDEADERLFQQMIDLQHLQSYTLVAEGEEDDFELRLSAAWMRLGDLLRANIGPTGLPKRHLMSDAKVTLSMFACYREALALNPLNDACWQKVGASHMGGKLAFQPYKVVPSHLHGGSPGVTETEVAPRAVETQGLQDSDYFDYTPPTSPSVDNSTLDQPRHPKQRLHQLQNGMVLKSLPLYLSHGAPEFVTRIDCYCNALKLNRHNAKAWLCLGYACSTSSSRAPKEVIVPPETSPISNRECFRRSAECDPSNPETWLLLGVHSPIGDHIVFHDGSRVSRRECLIRAIGTGSAAIQARANLHLAQECAVGDLVTVKEGSHTLRLEDRNVGMVRVPAAPHGSSSFPDTMFEINMP